ncbi:MAG: peptide deformylase [Spirochaetes bacterium]|jgi:peptide deformylase|nr:peptide deformylase [Spirochaetota bacterium]
MSNYTIKIYPDPVLRKISDEVHEINESTRALIKDMFEIMEEEGGIGLAAPQVGISKRIIVLSLKEKNFEKMALVNPVIVSSSKETAFMEEGCLSIPGINADVQRSTKLIARGLTRSGKMVEITASNLLTRVLLHEIDHLDGVLFIDRLSDKEKKKVEGDLQTLYQQYSTVTP